jgi:hypothetical protein
VRWGERALVGLTLALVGALFYTAIRRILWVCDYYTWAESPFLTNMLKLRAGQPIFGPDADANSWVYSPGLEYVCRLLLAPIGLSTDIRACRVVNVGLAIGGAVAAAFASVDVACAGIRERRVRYLAVSIGVFVLVLGRNFNFDQCHPDDIHVAHAALVFFLTVRALRSGSPTAALWTAVAAAPSVWMKQSAVLLPLGPLVVLTLANWRAWGRYVTVRFLLLGGVAYAGAVLGILAWPAARFYLFTVLARQPVTITQVHGLLADLYTPHRLLLLVLAGLLVFRALFDEDPRVRALLYAWLAVVPATAGAVPAYFKIHGLSNNLTCLDFAAAELAVPLLWRALPWSSRARADRPSEPPRGAGAAGALMLVLLTLFPVKVAPTAGQKATCQKLIQSLTDDNAHGLRVLLGHGTMPLVKAGYLEPPKDRSMSIGEVDSAGVGDIVETRRRLATRFYDKVYLVWGEFYGDDTLEVLGANYKKGGAIPKPTDVPEMDDSFLYGYQGFMAGPIIWFTRKAETQEPQTEPAGDEEEQEPDAPAE